MNVFTSFGLSVVPSAQYFCSQVFVPLLTFLLLPSLYNNCFEEVSHAAPTLQRFFSRKNGRR